MPETFATSGSNVENSRPRYIAARTTTTAMATPTMIHTSLVDTPSTLPNTVASMLCFTREYSPSSAMPNAKLAVVMTPIAASAAMIRRRDTRPIASPEASPQMPAPRKKFTPTAAQIAAPPKMAWLRPWPM